MAVPVSGKGLPAACAGIFIDRFFLDALRVSVPPVLPTGWGAEPPHAFPNTPSNRRTAVGAETGCRFFWHRRLGLRASDPVIAAERLDAVFGQTGCR